MMGRRRSDVGAKAAIVGCRRALSSVRQTLQGLPPRVLAAILGGALAVFLLLTAVSTYTMGDLVRDDLRRRFPALLHVASGRLDVWSTQRRLDLVAIAEGAIGSGGGKTIRAEAFARAGARASLLRRLERARRERPVFESIFVLDARGIETASVGRKTHLPAAVRRELVSALDSVPSRAVWLEDLDSLVYSASIPNDSTSHTLHALVRPDAVAAAIEPLDLGSAALYVTDARGAVLVAAGRHDGRRFYERTLPDADGPVVLEEYTTDGDLRVVASAALHPRFGWGLLVEEEEATAFAPVAVMMRRILGIHLAVVIVLGTAVILVAKRLLPIWRAEPIDEVEDEEGDDAPQSANADSGMLTRALHEMQRRAHRYRVELVQKRREVEDANERLRCQNERLVHANEVLERLSITDELTGLHNRRYFREHLPREMKRALRTGDSLALILFDIDDFKLLNDRFGHSVGDAVLRRVATVMSRETREMDLLARYGGEEFALLASHTPVAGAVALAEKIRLAVSRTQFGIVDLDGRFEVKVTISGGVASFRGDEKALFNDADTALYRAKASGKDCVVAARDLDDGEGVLEGGEA
jgi:diguanylate cyclase (GGDEF)-like protein